MKNDSILKKQKNMNMLLTLIGILFLLSSIFLVAYDRYLEQKAINISATIKTLDYSNGKYSATVTYKVEGKKYEQKVTLNSKKEELTVGDETTIKYNMDNPNMLVDNNHYLIALMIFIVSLIFLILNLKKTIINIKKSNNVKKLFKSGYVVEANIGEVITNNKAKKVKGLYPSKLRARYLNPADNKEYIFDSDDTYINLNEAIKNSGKNTVVVVIDKNNFQNYYVDIDSLFKQIKLVEPKDLMKNTSNEVKEESKEANEHETTEKISN